MKLLSGVQSVVKCTRRIFLLLVSVKLIRDFTCLDYGDYFIGNYFMGDCFIGEYFMAVYFIGNYCMGDYFMGGLFNRRLNPLR